MAFRLQRLRRWRLRLRDKGTVRARLNRTRRHDAHHCLRIEPSSLPMVSPKMCTQFHSTAWRTLGRPLLYLEQWLAELNLASAEWMISANTTAPAEQQEAPGSGAWCTKGCCITHRARYEERQDDQKQRKYVQTSSALIVASPTNTFTHSVIRLELHSTVVFPSKTPLK